MINISNIKLLPSKIYLIGSISIIAGFVNSLTIFGLAMLLQVFLFIVGFIELQNINHNLHFLTNNIPLFLVIFFFVIILQGVSLFFQSFINIIFSEKFNLEIKKKILNLIFNPESLYDFDIGTTSNIFSQIIPKSASYLNALLRFITLLIQIVIIALICLYLMPNLFVISLFFLSFTIPIFLYLNKKSKKYGTLIMQSNKKMSLQLMRSIKNYIFLSILGISKKEKNKAKIFANDYYSNFMRSNLYYSLSSSLPQTIGTVIMIILFYRFSGANSNSADVLSFFYLFYRLIGMLSQNVTILNNINLESPNFDNLMHILKKHSDLRKFADFENDDSAIIQIDFNKIPLKVSNLKFRYSSKTNYILKNISFNLNRSSILVVKGPSGSGKTTLLMSLIGILKNYTGQIIWFENNLKDYNHQNFRSVIGYVGPETYIIPGSIHENLCYGLSTIPSKDEIINACKMSESYKYIMQLEHGFDSKLSEQGEGLSMGQKQRLGLARAFLRNPKILIFDEFTANLDKENEDIIVENISQIRRDMTIIISTHSNSFDALGDKIINLNDQ